jgi:hypothetical protein
MRRVFNSSVRKVAVVVVMLMLAGSVPAGPREDQDRDRGRQTSIVKTVKRVVRALGDFLTIPRP